MSQPALPRTWDLLDALGRDLDADRDQALHVAVGVLQELLGHDAVLARVLAEHRLHKRTTRSPQSTQVRHGHVTQHQHRQS